MRLNKGFPGRNPRVSVEPQQRPVVVKHFLEMRNMPALIGTVAIKPATQLVIYSALRHLLESVDGHVQGFAVSGSKIAAQAEFQFSRMKKLGCIAKSAMDGVKPGLQFA